MTTQQAREQLARRMIRLRRDVTAPSLCPSPELADVLWRMAASCDFVADLLR